MLYSQKISHHSRSKKESLSYLNIMVVGSVGSGKTSFIRTFAETMKQNIVQGTFKESHQKSLKGCIQPTVEMYTISMHIEEEGRRTALSLIDTPGFTDNINEQIKEITDYIDSQFAHTLAEESKVKRDAKALDTHIHACIYFINDHHSITLSHKDKLALKSLSARVNVIPVISKADTLSNIQLDTLKKALKDDIFDVSRIPVYGNLQLDEDEDEEIDLDMDEGLCLSKTVERLKEFATEDEDARVMLEYLHTVPFSLISYEEEPQTGLPVQLSDESPYIEFSANDSTVSFSSTTGAPLLGRRYPWAVVECCNPVHCDFTTLKNMLMSSHREMLKLDTFECFYEKYRTQQLTGNQRADVSNFDQQLASPVSSLF